MNDAPFSARHGLTWAKEFCYPTYRIAELLIQRALQTSDLG
jgi:hypothetical protein